MTARINGMPLTVYLDESDKTLYGEVTVSDTEPEAVTPALIQQQLAALGYENLAINPQAVNQLCSAASKQEALKVALKTLIDAKADIQIASDKKQVTLALHQADGGMVIEPEQLKKMITDAGVAEALVDWPLVESALQRGQVSGLVIAHAKPPVKGEDAIYEALVQSEQDHGPVVDEQGVADMLSTHVFVMVEPGESLMRRHPATAGEPGMNVLGEAIAPVAGKDPGFKPDLQGAEIASTDSNLLIASLKGHPVVFANGVSVDPVLHVDNVDLQTGNIEFDGSLEVKGDVAAGLVIEVSGDVIVKGAVERARIKAGNQVIVQGGVFGHQDIDEDSGMESEDADLVFDIEAGGCVEVGFLNQVAIHSGTDIRVKQYAAHSFLKAEGCLYLGQNGGKGILYGGLAVGINGAVIAQAGNDSYVPTCLRIGKLDQLLKRQKQIDQELQARQAEAAQLQAIFDKINKKDPVMLGKVSVDKTRRIANTIAAIKQTISALHEEQKLLAEQIPPQKAVSLSITKRLCPNTLVTINGVAQRFTEEVRSDTWHQSGDRLIAASEAKED